VNASPSSALAHRFSSQNVQLVQRTKTGDRLGDHASDSAASIMAHKVRLARLAARVT